MDHTKNLSKSHLIEAAIKNEMGVLTPSGAFAVQTGKHTGRSANDRYFVRRPEVENEIDWGKTNKGVSPEFGAWFFEALKTRLESQDTHGFKGFVGSLGVEVTSPSPWHIAFASNMFRKERVVSDSFASLSELTSKSIRIYHLPFNQLSDLGISDDLRSQLRDGSEVLIVLDPVECCVGIVGTAYAGEIKKSAFTLCNFILPHYGILPMHASANCESDGSHSSVLFGLSGTGKTTLSASPDHDLIGDDEIMWTPTGISNLEGGCYAKLIDLDPAKEPDIFRATNQFGAIMENIVLHPENREPDFTDDSITENTRGSYGLEALDKVFDQSREASPPKTIVFLTADAFGAMPAVARLDEFQAQYHFISGYTAKVAGTEIGIQEPQAAFSCCFGAPFMPRHASVYAKMLSEKAKEYGATVWLLNTGWTKGAYGEGERFPIQVSRQILKAIQSGELDQVEMSKHPVFGFSVPKSCPGVDSEWLAIPQGDAVGKLARRFVDNMKSFESGGKIDEAVITRGGPLVGNSSSAKASVSRAHEASV